MRLAKKRKLKRRSNRRTNLRRSSASKTRNRRPVRQNVPVAIKDGVSLEVVGAAVGATRTKGRNTAVGGVSTVALRRTIIDQMIRENGWVENDYHKRVGNKRVYVVVAKAPDRYNRIQTRTFYFTESNGRIYRVSGRASPGSSESIVRKSENMIRSLNNGQKESQQAKK